MTKEMEKLLDLLPIPTAILRDGKVAYVNPALCAATRHEASRIVGRPQTDYIATQDLERVLERQRQRLRGEEVPPDYEARLVFPSGEQVDCLVYAMAHGGDIIVQVVDALLEAPHLIRELRDRNEELATLNLIAETAATVPDLPTFFERGGEQFLRHLPCVAFATWLLDPERRELVLAHQTGALPETLPFIQRIALGTPGPGQVAQDGAPCIQRADDHPSPFREASIREGQLSHVSVPLLVHSRIVGVLTAAFQEQADRAASKVSRLQAMAAPFAAALEAQRLLAEARRQAADLRALNDLTLSVFGTGPGDTHALLGAASGAIGRALQARAVMIWLIDERNALLRSAASWGEPLPPGEQQLPMSGLGLEARCLRSQIPVQCEDSIADCNCSTFRGVNDPLSVLLVPLTSRRAACGVVAIAGDRGRRFGTTEVALAQALTSAAAMGLENAELHAETRQRAEELARTQAQLVQRERLAALGEMSAVMAHEVRNPLAVIFNSLGSLKRLLVPEGDAKLLLEIIGEEADRLNRIVGDLLDFARPVTFTLRLGSVERLLAAAAAALGNDPDTIVLQHHVAPDLPLVPMDARLMRQAMINVAVNAVQAMPHGGTLSLSARRQEDSITIEISDTGIGIPDEIRHRIFEPFFTTKASGTGLGLAVVKQIVEGHQGRIEVESHPEKGTTFTIRLPLNDRP